MGRKLVVNASPLIFLAKINQLSLIKKLSDKTVIPRAVAAEILRGPESDPARQWLQTHGSDHLVELASIQSIITAWDLGQGEAEVIQWAFTHPNYTAVLDDRAARNCAKALQVKVVGTIGLILLAKKERHIIGVSPLLDQLQQAGCRINTDLLKSAKELAGED